VLQFDKSPFETKDIPDGDVKDLSWSPADEGVYFVLSHEGQLFRGGVGVDYEQLVESKVEAGVCPITSFVKIFWLLFCNYVYCGHWPTLSEKWECMIRVVAKREPHV